MKKRTAASFGDNDDFLDKLLRYIGRIANPEELLAIWFAIEDPKTPLHVKAILGGVTAYFLMPLDLLPDPIFADDVALAVSTLAGFAGNYVTAKHRRKAAAFLKDLFGDF